MLVVPGSRWPEKSASRGCPARSTDAAATSAHRSGASPPSPLNSGATTPTTIAVWPFSRDALPTIPGPPRSGSPRSDGAAPPSAGFRPPRPPRRRPVPSERRRAQLRQEVPGDEVGVRGLLFALGRETRGGGREHRDRACVPAVEGDGGIRDVRPVPVGALSLEAQDLLRARDRQRAEQGHVEGRERRHRGADADAQHQHRGRGEAGRRAHRAEREADVLDEIVEPVTIPRPRAHPPGSAACRRAAVRPRARPSRGGTPSPRAAPPSNRRRWSR